MSVTSPPVTAIVTMISLEAAIELTLKVVLVATVAAVDVEKDVASRFVPLAVAVSATVGDDALIV